MCLWREWDKINVWVLTDCCRSQAVKKNSWHYKYVIVHIVSYLKWSGEDVKTWLYIITEASSKSQDCSCPENDIKLHLIARLQSWSLGNVEISVITIILRSTSTQGCCTCYHPIYGSNRTVQSSTCDYYNVWFLLFNGKSTFVCYLMPKLPL